MRNNWNVKNGALKIELRSFGIRYENGMALAASAAEIATTKQSMCSFSYGTDKLLLLYSK